MRIIDISAPLRPGTDIVCKQPEELPVYLGYPCVEYEFHFHSHLGCYYETSAHLFPGQPNTSDVSIEQFFLPGVVARLDPDGHGVIEAEEIERAVMGKRRRGDALLVDTAGVQTRYFSRACGAWMATTGIALLAATLRTYDTGFVDPTGVFIELFEAEIPILAGVRLDHVARERVFLIVLPMAVEGICTVPCRAVVLEGESAEVEQMARWLRPDLQRKEG